MCECIDVFRCQQGFHLTYMKTEALFDQHNLLEKVVDIDDIDIEFCKLHCQSISWSLFKEINILKPILLVHNSNVSQPKTFPKYVKHFLFGRGN